MAAGLHQAFPNMVQHDHACFQAPGPYSDILAGCSVGYVRLLIVRMSKSERRNRSVRSICVMENADKILWLDLLLLAFNEVAELDYPFL